jgi:hypothetical protein
VSKQKDNIDSELGNWMRAQHVFFVATAPLGTDGHVNLSPKGGESFRILGPLEVVYHDYTGSGAETAAHLRENGRIVVMFCAFEGAPRIARLHGRGSLITAGQARYEEMAAQFPAHPSTRAFVHVAVERVSSSCGFGVPMLDFQGNRDAIERWAEKQGAEGLKTYRATKNRHSIDGLPAFDVT